MHAYTLNIVEHSFNNKIQSSCEDLYHFTQILRKVVYMFQQSTACGRFDPQLSNCQPSICQLVAILSHTPAANVDSFTS